MRVGHLVRLCLILLLVCGGLEMAVAAPLNVFTLKEPLGLNWGPDRVTYAVAFAQDAVTPSSLQLTDEAGQPVAMQLSDVQYWPGDKYVKSANLSFMATLVPSQQRVWSLTASDQPRQVATDLKASLLRQTGLIQLETGKTGVRLAAGTREFATPVEGDRVPAPLQGVRLLDGRWIGKGSWQTDVKCTGYSAQLTEAGPVFARARLRYDFEGGKYYAATVELNAGQDLAVVTEEYDLSAGERYPMSGLEGMKPDVQYAYVYPTFSSPERAITWDWWGQTHAKLPSFNHYIFSFSEGFHPNRAEFSGYNRYGNIEGTLVGGNGGPGEGDLKYDKDGRFAYVNAYAQWGDEETPYLGLYNTEQPGVMFGVMGLRPSQWVHPDVNPHPDGFLKQYTMTTCISFERRTTGEAFFRAPVDLGKRVYGIGSFERKVAVRDDPGPSYAPQLTQVESLGSDLRLRHMRMGRLELNTIKDWVLEYDETTQYPCMYVPPGDRARFLSREKRRPLAEVQEALAADPAADSMTAQQVEETRARLQGTAQYAALQDMGLMMYGIAECDLSEMAETALSLPACTPAQASEIRRYLAFLVYNSLNPDFVPPRSAGFAWGAIGMIPQLRVGGALLASLLPHHPLGKAWREELATFMTVFLEDQVNAAGSTQNCPHYGGIDSLLPILGLEALANTGEVDTTRFEARCRALAEMHLNTLHPYDIRGGFRTLSPEGDGYYSGDLAFSVLAGFFAKRDPDLAAQCQWGFEESDRQLGGSGPGDFIKGYKIFDVGIPAKTPELGSFNVPGYGFVMRNGFPREDETYIQAYAGSFCWGHGHQDRGTWVMYAKGAPLMMDFAAMYTPSMRENWLHPGGLTFNHDETVRPAGDDPKDDWWRKGADEQYRKTALAPFTDIEIRPSPTSAADLDRQGEVTAFKTTPQADYAEMQRRVSYLSRVPYLLEDPHGVNLFNDFSGQEIYLKNPFTWTRRFVFVKDEDPLGHNYLVIRDDLPGNSELDPALNLWCLATKVDLNGQTALYTGQHGVDLHCYIAEPVTFAPKTRTMGHPCGFGFAGFYKQQFGKDFREDQILLRIPQGKRDGGYFVAMVPVKQGEAAPQFETLADGKAIRVTFPDRVDTIILQSGGTEVEVSGQKITSSAALLLARGEKLEVVNLAPSPAG